MNPRTRVVKIRAGAQVIVIMACFRGGIRTCNSTTVEENVGLNVVVTSDIYSRGGKRGGRGYGYLNGY